jgi:hypothetical protein
LKKGATGGFEFDSSRCIVWTSSTNFRDTTLGTEARISDPRVMIKRAKTGHFLSTAIKDTKRPPPNQPVNVQALRLHDKANR